MFSLKVLHVGEYVKGGVATYINEVTSYQNKHNDISEVYLMVSKNYSDKQYSLNRENIIFYDYLRKPGYILKAIFDVHKAINRIKPDIVHVHSTFAGIFVRIPFFMKKSKPKIIYCSHGWSFLMDVSKKSKIAYSIVERALARKTDLIVNISKNEQNKSLQYKLPINKSIVIYNGISEKVSKNAVSLEISIDPHKINVLFVGRFDKQKGLDILIDFFNKYPNKKISLYLIGDGVLDNQHLDIPENVINIGWVDNYKLDSYYQMFDAIIMPSRWEGFGLVAVEAMKNKKPVIVSNIGALPELVKEEVNGYVFDLDNYERLNEIFNSMNKEALTRLGENGYRIYKDNFTSEIMNNKIVNEYKNLLGISVKQIEKERII
ncbi:glycosyltransferase [Guptibacillus sedimenti]|uniref:glycosyltransferase n=1 Tax=Guptibacillus sedimenti TaxID=3025680 RepID=UPI0030810F15